MDLTVTVAAGGPEDLDLSEIIDNERAAELAGVSESTIRTWVHDGDLEVAGYVGQKPYYTVREVARCEKAKRGPRTPLRNNVYIAALQIIEKRQQAAAKAASRAA